MRVRVHTRGCARVRVLVLTCGGSVGLGGRHVCRSVWGVGPLKGAELAAEVNLVLLLENPSHCLFEHF
jgi:hypothetical protein